jgi:NADP-dependent 3-hydroxy acid dehydrogenase YdfG
VSGLQGIENQAVYSASKHALSGFMTALAQEVKDEGVAITNLYPGGIDTDLWKRLPEEYDLDVSQFMQPQDISNVVKFVLRLPNHLILKEMTFFPTNDWH